MGLVTARVFRPVHMGRRTEWRCFPPSTATMMSSGRVARCTTPSSVTLGDSRSNSSSLLVPFRRSGMLAKGMVACSQRYSRTSAREMPSPAMMPASSMPRATSGVPPPKLPTSRWLPPRCMAMTSASDDSASCPELPAVCMGMKPLTPHTVTALCSGR